MICKNDIPIKRPAEKLLNMSIILLFENNFKLKKGNIAKIHTSDAKIKAAMILDSIYVLREF